MQKIFEGLILVSLTLSSINLKAASENGDPNAVLSDPRGYYNVQLLTNNEDAFKVKLDMVKRASPPQASTHDTGIDMIYFIWEDDKTSSLLMKELMEKADQGVQIRILVDYFETQAQVPALLMLANHKDHFGNKNIQVKRFHPPSTKLISNLSEMGIDANRLLIGMMIEDPKMMLAAVENSSVYQTVKANLKPTKSDKDEKGGESHGFFSYLDFTLELLNEVKHPEIAFRLDDFARRSHYKLLLVNKSEFVMGGRNISDQYHTSENSPFILPLGRRYAFNDTEVSATQSGGDTTQEENFLRMWNSIDSVNVDTHYISETGTNLPAPLDETVILSRAEEAVQAGFDNNLLSNSTKIDGPVRGQIFENSANTYVNSHGKFFGIRGAEHHRDIAKEYVKLIKAATTSIDIVTAYFYIDHNSFLTFDGAFAEIIDALKDAAHNRHVEVNIYTNDLLTTDLAIVNEVSYRVYGELKEAGIHVYELDAGDGKCPANFPANTTCPSQGSLHTKVMVVDGHYLAVGSFNLDPRSEMYDTNNIIVLDDNGESLLVKAFHKARIEDLHWHLVDPKFYEEHKFDKEGKVPWMAFKNLRSLI